MRVKSVASLLFLGLSLLCGSAIRADDAVKDILDKAMQAHGGPSGAAKLQNVFLKGKSSITEGGNTISIAFDLLMQGLDKARMELEINSMFPLTLALNGDKS